MTGDEIKALRSRVGLTAVDLSALLGVTASTLSRWEVRPNHAPDARSQAVLRAMQALTDRGKLPADLATSIHCRGGLYALHRVLAAFFALETP